MIWAWGLGLGAGLNCGALSVRVCIPQIRNNGTCFCGLLKGVNEECFMGLEVGARTQLTLKSSLCKQRRPAGGVRWRYRHGPAA